MRQLVQRLVIMAVLLMIVSQHAYGRTLSIGVVGGSIGVVGGSIGVVGGDAQGADTQALILN